MSQRSGVVPSDDVPFRLPVDALEIVLDLPFPPSVNHIWRHVKKGRVFRSARYMRWLKNCDMAVIASRQLPRLKITGHFEADIRLSRGAGHGDVDNRIKATLDWLVSREIVRDDQDCQDVRARWVEHADAPAGARVTLRSLHG